MAVKDGTLWHYSDYQGEKRRKGMKIQLVVPTALQPHFLQWAHEGQFETHLGRDKAFEALNDNYYWVNMYGDLATYIRQCAQCQLVKEPAAQLRFRPGILQRPSPSQPFQVVHIDVCTILSTELMIFTCAFTSYMEVVVMRGAINGRTLSEAFLNHIVCRHSTPSIVISDNISYQASGEFPKVLRALGIRFAPVTKYHPQANGRVERKVAILKELLRSLAFKYPGHFKTLVPIAVFAYNTSTCASTGEKPFFLVHGREPILPGPINVAVSYEKLKGERTDTSEYTKALCKRILTAFAATYKKLRTIQENYTHPNLLEPTFQLGDIVFLHRDVKSKDTLMPKWSGPYIVSKIISPAVYQIFDMKNTSTLAHVSRLKKAI